MNIYSIAQATNNATDSPGVPMPQSSDGFGDVLEQVVQDTGGIHFSSHAQKRLDERSI